MNIIDKLGTILIGIITILGLLSMLNAISINFFVFNSEILLILFLSICIILSIIQTIKK